MKKTVLAMALCSSILLAESKNLYVEVGGNFLTHDKDENGLKSDMDSTALKVTLGSVLMEKKNYHVSLEGLVMLGLEGDTKASVTQNSGTQLTNAKLYVDKLYGLNLKVTAPLTTDFNVHAYLGASHAKTIAKADNYNKSNDFQSSLTYGVGMDYAFASNVYLYANYMQYFDNLSAFEGGLGFRF